MNRIVGFLRAAYNFFAGDAILLTGVAVAFILAAVLGRLLGTAHEVAAGAKAPAAIAYIAVAVVFVGIIVLGLVTTLGREIAGRPRQR